jgi:hypothetical protein
MSVKVKLIDRRPELQKFLKTAAGKVVEACAMRCHTIARQLVSKRYQRRREARRRERLRNAEASKEPDQTT